MSEVVVGTANLLKKFKSLSEVGQAMSLAHAVQAGSTVILNAAKENVKDNGLMRTRTLSRSLHSELTMNGSTEAKAEIGTDLEYAAIHEFGGTVHARSSKYLAIPVGTYKGSPRSHLDLKLRKTAGGNLVMVSPSGQVQYVLKASVTVPAAPYLRPAMDENKDEAVNKMADAFVKLIQKAVAE